MYRPEIKARIGITAVLGALWNEAAILKTHEDLQGHVYTSRSLKFGAWNLLHHAPLALFKPPGCVNPDVPTFTLLPTRTLHLATLR